MKTNGLKQIIPVCILMAGSMAALGQQGRLEVPGDHFSLEGALELFKRSSSLEEFERLLNSADSKVNNLDLNDDGYVDYIRVIDRQAGNVHAFILQAAISEYESQDVAVIELEKLDNGKAVLQITGDEDIYGVETIIEPTQEVRTYAGATTSREVVNVWTWPTVRYVYSPSYVVWVSPWRWTYRPHWYYRWQPVTYYVYEPWWRPYRPYYSVCYSPRIYAPHVYRPHRTTSVYVYNRYHTHISSYRTHHGYSGRNNYRDRSTFDHPRDNYNRHRTTDRTQTYTKHTEPDRHVLTTQRPRETYMTPRSSGQPDFNRGNVRTNPGVSLPTDRVRERSSSVPQKQFNTGTTTHRRSESRTESSTTPPRKAQYQSDMKQNHMSLDNSRRSQSPAQRNGGGSQGPQGNKRGRQ